MHHEFEEIAGYKVSAETYNTIIEPMYMALDLDKKTFCGLLNRKALEEKPVHVPHPVRMKVRDRSGYDHTPNHCYYHIEWVDMVGADIRTGKTIVAPLPDAVLEDLARTRDLDLDTWYDVDYTNCIDHKTKKPVELHWTW